MGTVHGRVLVIDDDPFMLKVICDLLQKAGFHVITQESPLGATQVIVRERIDAAVIDWNLPILQGDEVIRLLRTWDSIRELPVLLITGAPEPAVMRIREELPGVRVLSKDHLRQDLVPTLGSVVSSGKTVRGLSPIKSDQRGDFASAPQRPQMKELVPQLLAQVAESMPQVASVWSEAARGRVERVAPLLQTLEQLAGQARLLALEEAAMVISALAETLRAVPRDKKVPRDIRRAVEESMAALASLSSSSEGAFAMPPEPLIGRLQRARASLSAQS
jgi:CheY-like chemotaxis protein